MRHRSGRELDTGVLLSDSLQVRILLALLGPSPLRTPRLIGQDPCRLEAALACSFLRCRGTCVQFIYSTAVSPTAPLHRYLPIHAVERHV